MSAQFTTPENPIPALPVDEASPPQEAARLRQERRKTYGTLTEYLKNTCKKVETEDQQPRLEILRQQNRCQAYYDNRQYGKWNEKGEWVDSPYDPAEFRPQDNKFKEQVDKLQMEMARSSVDLSVEPIDKTDSAMTEAAEFFKSRIDANRKRLFTQRPEFVLSENMSLLLKTITYRYTYFDQGAEDSPREKVPVFDKTTLGEEKSLTVCANCGKAWQDAAPPLVPDEQGMSASTGLGTIADDQPCPRCGSTVAKTLSTSPVELELPAGEEEKPTGLPQCVHADPTAVHVSMNARNMQISSSPYLIWEQSVERGKLEKMFPDKIIPSTASDEQTKYKSENEQAVSNSPFNSSTVEVKGGEQFEKLKFKLVWLDAWVYEDYATNTPQKLPDGSELPANTPLIQLFPKGLCIAKVGDTLLALYDEDKNKKWSVCVYGLREHSWHGSGTNALIPIQITINDLLGWRIANVYYNTFRREFIRQGALSADQLPTLTQVGIVNNLDEGRDIIGGAYQQAPPIPLSPEVPQLSEEQSGALQEQAGTSSLSLAGTSAESQALGTATGIAAMRDLAVGRMGPNLMLKSGMEVETAFQMEELEQKNYSRQQLMAFAGLRPGAVGNLGYTQRGVDAFINCNLRASFNITPSNWMPVTEQEKKADAIAYADSSSKVQDPEVIGNLAKVFKQPTQLGGWNATEREAARRIEEFSKVVQILMQRGFTESSDQMAQVVLDSAVDAHVSVEMDNHPAYIQFYKNWWVSDESRNAPPLLKAAVRLRTIEHENAMVQDAQRNKVNTLRTQIPDMVAQQKVAQAQGEQELSQTRQANQMEMEHAGAKMALEHEGARADLEHQSASNELAARDREHALGTKVIDREHQAAMRPPAQP